MQVIRGFDIFIVIAYLALIPLFGLFFKRYVPYIFPQ